MTKVLIDASNAEHVIDNIREADPVMAYHDNNNDNSDNYDEGADEVDETIITRTTTATTTATVTTTDNVTSELNDDDESDRKLLKVSWTGQDKINQLYYHHGLYF